MTDHGGAASPRTEALPALAKAIQEADFYGLADAVIPVKHAMTLLHRVIEAERTAAEAAQEAPAPEGLRDLLDSVHPWRIALESIARHSGDPGSRFVASQALATPPTPAEPPDWHEVHFPVRAFEPRYCPDCGEEYHGTTCGYRAEARPPEGLDLAWAIAEAAVKESMPGGGFGVQADGPGYRATAGHPEWHGGSAEAWSVDDPELVGDPDSPATPAKALLKLAARLSAGGATTRECAICGATVPVAIWTRHLENGCQPEDTASGSAGGATKP